MSDGLKWWKHYSFKVISFPIAPSPVIFLFTHPSFLSVTLISHYTIWLHSIKRVPLYFLFGATTSDISRWNTLPSYPYSMLHGVVNACLHLFHGVVNACLHLFGWNYFTTLSCGRGRETQLYRQCFNKVTLIVVYMGVFKQQEGYGCIFQVTVTLLPTQYYYTLLACCLKNVKAMLLQVCLSLITLSWLTCRVFQIN